MMTCKKPSILFVLIFFAATNALALCESNFVNPVTEVAWNFMFPVRIGAFTVFGSDEPDPDPIGAGSSPVCTCPGPQGLPIPGILVSFWEPTYIFEAVQDPFCFPSMGAGISNVVEGAKLKGTLQQQQGKGVTPHFFAQAHFIKFAAWQVLGMIEDIPCVTREEDFDIGYLTETDPMWQSDLMSLVISPEALVFANPALQLACVADAVSTIADLPRNELFWCMGQWGTAYPFTGSVTTDNIVGGSAAAAAKLLYKMHRQGVICDSNISACGCTYAPIWHKSHYKMQVLRPKVLYETIRIGEPTTLWEYGLSSPLEKGADNFAFIVWKKVSCCMTYNPF